MRISKALLLLSLCQTGDPVLSDTDTVTITVRDQNDRPTLEATQRKTRVISENVVGGVTDNPCPASTSVEECNLEGRRKGNPIPVPVEAEDEDIADVGTGQRPADWRSISYEIVSSTPEFGTNFFEISTQNDQGIISTSSAIDFETFATFNPSDSTISSAVDLLISARIVRPT